MAKDSSAFEHVPRTAAGAFVLYLYAAIYRLMKQINRLSEASGADLESLFEQYSVPGGLLRGDAPADARQDLVGRRRQLVA